jgi:DNA-binding response OmpR family regulator
MEEDFGLNVLDAPLGGRVGQVKRHTILVVDDSEIARDFARYALEAAFDVVAAASVIEAEELLARVSPDLVLLDIHLRDSPDVSGVDLCRRLKGRLAHLVPVILFSARSDEELAVLADECGADGYLSKIKGPHALARKVHEIRSMILW